MKKRFFGYIRLPADPAKRNNLEVLRARQQAQINRCARKNFFEISGWFEDDQTASRTKRPKFSEMIKAMIAGKADGIILERPEAIRSVALHAELGAVIGSGREVHFADGSSRSKLITRTAILRESLETLFS